MLAALKVNKEALKYADASLKRNKEFLLDALKINWKALEYADESLKGNADDFFSVAQK